MRWHWPWIRNEARFVHWVAGFPLVVLLFGYLPQRAAAAYFARRAAEIRFPVLRASVLRASDHLTGAFARLSWAWMMAVPIMTMVMFGLGFNMGLGSAVGLALIIAVYRLRHKVDTDELAELKG